MSSVPSNPPVPAFDDDPWHDPVVRRLAIVVILGAAMSILDTTIVNVAIETLSRDFHARISTIQWVTTGYLLALSVVIPISGWVVERFGSKRMWMLSLTLFTLGSALCGLAWSPGSLIFFRVLQGLGGGMIMPIGMTILARAAGPQRMGRIMTLIGVPTLIAPVLGPVIGGLIVDNLTWRWIFFVNVPIGIVALVLSSRFLATGDHQDAGGFDFLGVALLSPGLAIIAYGLSKAGGGSGFSDTTVEACLAFGLLLTVAFVLHALRAERPLLDVRLFRERSFNMANITTFIFGATLYGAMFLIPLYYQVVRGESALNAGLLLAPQGIGAMISMPLGGRITDRYGARWVVTIGMAVFLVSTFAYTQLGTSTSYAMLATALFVRGLGMGWTMMPTMSAAYMRLSRAAVPRATTILNILMRVGGSFGTALVAVVLERQAATRLPRFPNILASAPPSGRLPQGVAQGLSDAFSYSFWVVMGVTAVGLVSAFLLPSGPAVPQGANLGVEARGEPEPEAELAAAGPSEV
jgi:EmrB/QacA subfamily drug resistance transporter